MTGLLSKSHVVLNNMGLQSLTNLFTYTVYIVPVLFLIQHFYDTGQSASVDEVDQHLSTYISKKKTFLLNFVLKLTSKVSSKFCKLSDKKG